ncbi:MAG TPA: crotonase/enoyl-CoA hydratase family protein [Stellaceae bacterium]|nr:crotonase/enoyl-CoA hydratase family protein [Stellaceae bacterium]
MSIRVEKDGPVTTVIIDRPEARNAVNPTMAMALAEAFLAFDADDTAKVGVLYGEHGVFCAGFDLKVASTEAGTGWAKAEGNIGPMGPTRLLLKKPVIAAVAGYAVAGGLELALWCDLRVAEENAIFGVFCRRWGVPLRDGGTVRLPRLIGHSRALDMILTGRPVGAVEALTMGLANRVVPGGTAREAAEALARELAALPQLCLRSDRLSSYQQWDRDFAAAMANEFKLGDAVKASGESREGAMRFAKGAGRHGAPDSR